MFQNDTPLHVIKEALILQKTKKGDPKEKVENLVEEKLKEAEKDPELWEELIKTLNKKLEKGAFDADPDLVDID